jgi:crotonobetainyl-CoA:carnitine CoA-transferase CaiB-like acyl-CoA transferase
MNGEDNLRYSPRFQPRPHWRAWMVSARVAEAVGTAKKTDLMVLAERAGTPFAPVARPQDLCDDPHLNPSGGCVTTILPGGGIATLPKISLRLNHMSFGLRRNPSGIGEGSLESYRACNLSDPEIYIQVKEGSIEAN